MNTSIKQNSSAGAKVFDVIVKVSLLLVVAFTLYPLIYVLSMSISSKEAVISQSVVFLPKGFSLDSYKLVFQNPDVLSGYYNSIWYTVVGAGLSLAVTVLGAYPMSRKDFIFRKGFMKIIVFTMYFSGGMIPTFIVVQRLGLYNTRWAIVLPSLVTGLYFIICRTFFENIPDGIIESAKIDGCNDFMILLKIVIPISKAIIAVLLLYYAVDRWNSYFPAQIYLLDNELKPIQSYLTKVLVQFSDNAGVGQLQDMSERAAFAVQLRYALIVVTTLPIMVVYPFLQKYFVQGVMVGSMKE